MNRDYKMFLFLVMRFTGLYIINLMHGPEGNSLFSVFPRVLMFRLGKHQDSRENKTN